MYPFATRVNIVILLYIYKKRNRQPWFSVRMCREYETTLITRFMGPIWGWQDPGGPLEPCYLGNGLVLIYELLSRGTFGSQDGKVLTQIRRFERNSHEIAFLQLQK